MTPAGMGTQFNFDRFMLDSGERRLARDGVPVELNARYLDALTLLVAQPGKLVTKDHFLSDVWRGVPVTDEALTQCIKTLRRALGDDAARPRFIETVPKHGYRFVAAVEAGAIPPPASASTPSLAPPVASDWRRALTLGIAGTIGGGIAGIVGGLGYGFVGASLASPAGMGAASVLTVLLCITLTIALIGGGGVAFGIAAAGLASGDRWRWAVPGAAAGGLIVAALFKLLGHDTFELLLGQSPGDFTGAPEGVVVGTAVGLAAWLGRRDPASGLRRGTAIAALLGGGAGILVTALGGHLLAGSLDLLLHRMPGARLRFDPVGGWFDPTGLTLVAQVVTGGLEGALFAAGVVGAMLTAERAFTDAR